MVALKEILQLPVLRGARVVAGHKGLSAPVRWCHVSEVTDIARLLSGGELLLTTGIGLDMPPSEQTAYVDSLRERGVSGLMLELERKFSAAPAAMVAAANRGGLPLITLPFDTPFVQVTEAVHTLILSQTARLQAERAEEAVVHLLSDLGAGRISEPDALGRRIEGLGCHLPNPTCLGVLTAGPEVAMAAVQTAAARILGAQHFLTGRVGPEIHLLAFAPERDRLTAGLRALALGLAPGPTGVGRAVAHPGAWDRSLAEARQTMSLRRANPALSPLFEETGVYQLALDRSDDELHQYVNVWLGPLIQYDQVHRSNMCQTLRFLLDDRVGLAEVAHRLHLSRQGVYHRLERIAHLVGRDLEDAEVRLALSVALRFQDVLTCGQSDGPA